MSVDLSNVRAVARREYLVRARTRTFKTTTLILIVIALGISLAPILFRVLDRAEGPSRIEVFVGDSKPGVDVVASLDRLLNPAPAVPGGPSGSATTEYTVTNADSESAGREDVRAGRATALIVVARRASDQELVFTFVGKASPSERLPQTIQQAALGVAVQDRLSRLGIAPVDQAPLFVAPAYSLEPPSGVSAPGTGQGPGGSDYAIGFVLAIVIFMAIILYGQWVAYSVAEEKSSRVMEVILGAATPFELLGGKVAGVGALAMTQYVIVFVPAAIAVIFQDQISALVLGQGSASAALPAGVSLSLLLAFGGFFVLGFALYAVLYAGAAALVSRTEDINQIVAPMTLLSTAGYLVAVYSSTGLLDPSSSVVIALSYVPFFSPYVMLTRMGSGSASGLDAAIAIAILAVSVPIALWFAARLYAAGVLMYGQRPGLRLVLRMLRSGAR